jgi:anthranilate phosphoribosyltransferase
MKNLLNKIIQHEPLHTEEAYKLLHAIDNEIVDDVFVAALLTGIQMRGLHLNELVGFRKALLELCIVPEIDGSNAIDLCGTGGDGKNTFNISTTTAFIVSSMGYKVIKHGNYGVSSLCGSSNVLEELGYKFTQDSSELNVQLNSKNLCFLHAPLFHPTMKKVAGVRRSLGIQTIFNCLGPLVNPVQPEFQMTGTYSLELNRIYSHILKNSRSDFRVIYGLDGYDEITLTDQAKISGRSSDLVLDAHKLGIEKIDPTLIEGGSSIEEAAEIVRNILSGNGTKSQNEVIASNAAVAIQTIEPQHKIKDLFHASLDHISSGKAIQQLN